MRLRIGALDVPVEVDEELDDFGQFQSTGPKIVLGPDQSPLVRATTLFHETLHAISEFYGLNLSEAKVRVLEHAITSMFRDNPDWALDFFDALTEEE